MRTSVGPVGTERIAQVVLEERLLVWVWVTVRQVPIVCRSNDCSCLVLPSAFNRCRMTITAFRFMS